jgi:hypothetical protein
MKGTLKKIEGNWKIINEASYKEYQVDPSDEHELNKAFTISNPRQVKYEVVIQDDGTQRAKIIDPPTKS